MRDTSHDGSQVSRLLCIVPASGLRRPSRFLGSDAARDSRLWCRHSAPRSTLLFLCIHNGTYHRSGQEYAPDFVLRSDSDRDLNNFIQKANENHFGFGDIQVTEQAQFTEYPEGGFYDWHMDCDLIMKHEPPVRKISMTLVLSPETDFEGGGLELAKPGQIMRPKQGHAVFFASFVMHRVVPVTKGLRKSLVLWFGGEPFK